MYDEFNQVGSKLLPIGLMEELVDGECESVRNTSLASLKNVDLSAYYYYLELSQAFRSISVNLFNVL